MSWTLNDVIIQAREIIQDTRAESYRHSDAKLLRYLNHAVSEAVRLRPDLFITDNEGSSLSEPRDFASVDDLDDPFPIEEQYFSPFVFYVAGMVGLGDDEYANDGRAAGLMNMFRVQLTGRNATS